jgi:UDP-galactopyranose mutase
MHDAPTTTTRQVSGEAKVLVVGMGFAGITVARTLADGGVRVHLVEKRDHIGGNAYDELDAAGVRVHRYGAHVFHTNSDRVLAFLGRFTAWRPYEHRVLASVDGHLLPFPINRTTINRLYGMALDEAGVASFLAQVRVVRDPIVTSEDVVLAGVGSELCEKFFRGYTRKHWGLDLSELSAGVAARIPVRTNDDDRYFSDRHQCMPADGYTAMFHRMLDHPLISYQTRAEFSRAHGMGGARHLVYTGPIDAYFDWQYGKLPYRSLKFEHEHLSDTARVQPVAVVNYPCDVPFTRIAEFKHLTGQVHAGTSIAREYPRADGEPYYPVPRPANEALHKRYEALAADCEDVTFVGRLAQYRYYNMDQVVAAALTVAPRVLERLG